MENTSTNSKTTAQLRFRDLKPGQIFSLIKPPSPQWAGKFIKVEECRTGDDSVIAAREDGGLVIYEDAICPETECRLESFLGALPEPKWEAPEMENRNYA